MAVVLTAGVLGLSRFLGPECTSAGSGWFQARRAHSACPEGSTCPASSVDMGVLSFTPAYATYCGTILQIQLFLLLFKDQNLL